MAEQHNAKIVTPRGVGLAIQGAPNRRFVATAYELASWAQEPPRPIVDVVSTYRTFLKRAEVCAGIEPINGIRSAATPIGIPAGVAYDAETNRQQRERLQQQADERRRLAAEREEREFA